MYVLAPIKHHNFEIKNRKREKSYLTRRRQSEKIRETEKLTLNVSLSDSIDFRKFSVDKERGAGEAKNLFERSRKRRNEKRSEIPNAFCLHNCME
jgi:hypothetical protein